MDKGMRGYLADAKLSMQIVDTKDSSAHTLADQAEDSYGRLQQAYARAKELFKLADGLQMSKEEEKQLNGYAAVIPTSLTGQLHLMRTTSRL
jgi:type II secretory pathway component PulK